MERTQVIQQTLSLSLSQVEPGDNNRTGNRDALRSALVQNVSHELRTPLSIVLSYIEMLHDGHLGELETEQKRALSKAINSVHELCKIVERFGILMTMETDTMFSVPLNLAETATQVVEDRRVEATRAGIDLVTRFEQNLPLVSGNPHHIQQAVDCLIENALKFTPTGGQVEVNVYAEPGWTCLAVTDTGIGISETELERIFSGFYQVDGIPSHRYGGLGLGLTLVQAVVKEHGGSIEVTSLPDQGSQFIVKFPARRMTARWLRRLKRWQHCQPNYPLQAERQKEQEVTPLFKGGPFLFPAPGKARRHHVVLHAQPQWQDAKRRFH